MPSDGTKVTGMEIVDRSIVKSIRSIVSNLDRTDLVGAFDGICHVQTKRHREFLFVNHELDDSAKVSRITYKDGACKKIEYWNDNGLRTLCSMFTTPWNTILTNEEHPGGYVWELHPTDPTVCKKRPLLGKMKHEKTIYVPTNGPSRYDFYTTDDNRTGGGIFKFTPKRYTKLSKGRLYGFTSTTGKVGDAKIRGRWKRVHEPENATTLDGLVSFLKLEGLTYNTYDNHIYFCVSADNRHGGLGYIYKLNPRTCTAKMVVNCNETNGALANPDNIGSDPFGNLYVCEGKKVTKGGVPNRLVYIDSKTHEIKTLLKGTDEKGEVTGIEFDKRNYARFWVNWKDGVKDGREYSELLEVHLEQ